MGYYFSTATSTMLLCLAAQLKGHKRHCLQLAGRCHKPLQRGSQAPGSLPRLPVVGLGCQSIHHYAGLLGCQACALLNACKEALSVGLLLEQMLQALEVFNILLHYALSLYAPKRTA